MGARSFLVDGDHVDLRRGELPLLRVGQALYLVVENTGAEPAIVRPVVKGDHVDYFAAFEPGKNSLLWMPNGAVTEDDLDVAAACGSLRRSNPMGMEHGSKRRSFAVSGGSYGFVIWNAIMGSCPKAYRIHVASGPPEDLVVTEIRYGNRCVWDAHGQSEPKTIAEAVGQRERPVLGDVVTGDWQPFPMPDDGDRYLPAGFSMSVTLRNKSPEVRHVMVELRVETEAS
jgi:hypothetical protein